MLNTMVRIVELNLHIHMVVWRKGIVSLLPTPNVVETILVFVVRDPLVFLGNVRVGIS